MHEHEPLDWPRCGRGKGVGSMFAPLPARIRRRASILLGPSQRRTPWPREEQAGQTVPHRRVRAQHVLDITALELLHVLDGTASGDAPACIPEALDASPPELEDLAVRSVKPL